MLPLHLLAEISARGVDALLRFIRPLAPIVRRKRHHPRDSTLDHERPNFLDALAQPPVEREFAAGVEQGAHRIDHLGDTVCRKLGNTIESLAILALNHGNSQLAIHRLFEMQRVDAEIAAAFDDAIQGFFIVQTKHGFQDEQHERRRPPLVLIPPQRELVGEGVMVPLDKAGDLLIDDLCRERHSLATTDREDSGIHFGTVCRISPIGPNRPRKRRA